jgi:hypothetical protein
MSAAHSSLVADGPVEQDQRAPLGYGRHDRRAFLGPPFIGPARPRFADLANIDAGEACAPGALPEPLEVAIEQQALRPRLQFADANQRKAHRFRSRAPQLLPASPGRSALHIFSRL